MNLALSCRQIARPSPNELESTKTSSSPVGTGAGRVRTERVERERENECLGRFERYLRRLGILDDRLAEKAREEAKSTMRAGIQAAEALPPPDPELVFAHAYAEPPPGLRDG